MKIVFAMTNNRKQDTCTTLDQPLWNLMIIDSSGAARVGV